MYFYGTNFSQRASSTKYKEQYTILIYNNVDEVNERMMVKGGRTTHRENFEYASKVLFFTKFSI